MGVKIFGIFHLNYRILVLGSDPAALKQLKSSTKIFQEK
jgi:hypothetical protein